MILRCVDVYACFLLMVCESCASNIYIFFVISYKSLCLSNLLSLQQTAVTHILFSLIGYNSVFNNDESILCLIAV